MHELFLSLYFDQGTEQAVRNLWEKIAAKGIEVRGLAGYRPHLTLAAYKTERPELYGEWVEAFVQTQVRLPLRLLSPAVFLSTNTVYLAPNLGSVWFEMHTRLLNFLQEQGADSQHRANHIDIGTWVPHCTLVTEVELTDVPTVLGVCQAEWGVSAGFEGYAEGIGVVVFPEPFDRSQHRFAVPETAAEYGIRLARLGELVQIQALEWAAGQRFGLVGMDEVAAMEPIALELLAARQKVGQLWVAVTAADEVAGFLMADWIDGEVILEEVSVHPDHGHRGLGSRLTNFVCAWAAAQGSKSVVLSTFKDVVWNAPFYARLGFGMLEEDGLTSGLIQVREEEAAAGLDVGRRVFMRKMVSGVRD